jgi:allantoin racemase
MNQASHETGGRLRRLLVINPNTNPAVTEQVRSAAILAAGQGTLIEALNPQTGPFSIETADDRAAAVPNVVSLVTNGLEHGYDGYVLACFDDIGVAQARELAGETPVISMFGASVEAARALGGTVVIVTTVESALPSIHRLIDAYGIGDWCSVRAIGVGVAETAARTPFAEERLEATIKQAIEDGAVGIILGSGALSGRADELQTRFAIRAIDGLAEAVRR